MRACVRECLRVRASEHEPERASLSVRVIARVCVGEGRGFSSTSGSSGGGHGGSGGQGQGHSLTGRAYGSFLNPSVHGSSGGHSIFPHAGGRGGGRLRLEVGNFLTVDGTVSANGGDFESPRAGGGSGGSVLIHTHVVDGDGSIQVGGGAGYSGSSHDGGGGGGGRLAVYYVQNYFVGKFSLLYNYAVEIRVGKFSFVCHRNSCW